jgi:small neutral amino acid transporter SnatA (MarC family)
LYKVIYDFVGIMFKLFMVLGIPLLLINFWICFTKSYKTRKAKVIGYIFIIWFISYELFVRSTPEHFISLFIAIYIWHNITTSYKTRRAKIIGYILCILFITYILFSRISPMIRTWNDIMNKHYSSILDDLIGLLCFYFSVQLFTKKVLKKGN